MDLDLIKPGETGDHATPFYPCYFAGNTSYSCVRLLMGNTLHSKYVNNS